MQKFAQSARKTDRHLKFAEVVKGAQEIVIRRQNDFHISQTEFLKFQQALQEDYERLIGENAWIPDITQQLYTSKRASIFVDNKESADHVRSLVARLGLKAVAATDVDFTPARIFKGFVAKPQGHRGPEALAAVINRQKRELHMPGKITIHNVINTPAGCLLQIAVDEEALESFQKMDFTLRVGTAGKIIFEDLHKSDTRLDRRRDQALAKREELRQLLEEKSKEIADLEAQIRVREDMNETTSSLVSLQMETDDAEAAHGSKTK